MCLSVAVDRPEDVLAAGTHAGHEFMIVHNGLGHRCGYVKVEPGHPWHGVDENDLDGVRVHGGLTFARLDKPCGKGGEDNGWWLGFDCAHAGDAPDPALPLREGASDYGLLSRHGDVRTQEYVEAECRSLCEQAAQAAVPQAA